MIRTEKIRGRMAELNIKVIDLAEALGISRQAMSDKLNGKTNITFSDANTISRKLRLTKEDRENIFFADLTSDNSQEAV